MDPRADGCSENRGEVTEQEKAIRGYISLEIIMAHFSVTGVPSHAFDTAVGEILTRIEVFAGTLAILVDLLLASKRKPITCLNLISFRFVGRSRRLVLD
jgi:hypothetical protein